MASLEWRVINELLRSKDMNAVAKLGFTVDHLAGEPEAAQIFEFMHNWYHHPNTSGQFPTMQAIKKRWPSFMKTGESDVGSIRTLLAECKGAAVVSDLRSLASYFQELVDEQIDDPEVVVKTMQSQLSSSLYSSQTVSGFSLREIARSVRAQYEGVGSGSIYGIPWPWECLTQDTLGKHREDFIVLYGRMKSMKCVCEGERIMMADGALVPIEDVPEKTKVPSYTDETGKIRWASARRVKSGTKTCVEVTTKNGHRACTSEDHLYMVPGGKYKRIKDLEVGDWIATARRLPDWKPSSDLSPEDAFSVGLVVSGGKLTKTLLQIFQKATNETLSIVKGQTLHVPEVIFRSSREAIAAFIAGVLTMRGSFSEDYVRVHSIERRFLQDLQHLLLRFDIQCSVHETIEGRFWLYNHSSKDAATLLRILGPYFSSPQKEEQLRQMADKVKRVNGNHPFYEELYDMVMEAKGDRTWPKDPPMASTDIFRTNGVNREALGRFAEYCQSAALAKEANNDIQWDRIQQIEPVGQVPCYDICITDGADPNFVVENFIVHNTWVLLKNAIDDYMVHNRRVLIWSREMNEAKMSLRAGSILGGVDYQMLKNGTLPYPLYERAVTGIESMAAVLHNSERILHRLTKEKDYEEKKGGADLFVVCGRFAPRSLEAFDAVVRAFNPDVVYLDSMYHMECASMMRMKSDHERQRELAVQLKQRAVDWGVPVIGTTQANREGDKTHGETMVDVGRTDALAQEADLIIRVLYKKGPEPYEDDYEGYWQRLKEGQKVLDEKRAVIAANRMKLRITRAAAQRFCRPRTGAVPSKVVQKFDRFPEEPRKAAELFLMMGGNREGVLEGFSIRCIPGYTWDVTRSSVSAAEAKKLFSDKEPKHTEGKKRPSKDRAKVVSPADTGMSYRVED